MKVLVTGASGFVGSHTVKALLEAGHDIRGLVRSAARLERALEPLGCADSVEVVGGDMLDPTAVEKALDDCEAVVHAAAVLSYDARRKGEMLSSNVQGAELVLSKACERGLDPVVHVSSVVALLPSQGTLAPASPVGTPRPAYALSKAASDGVARRLQAEGAPVTIVYPGTVWGPDDPNFGEAATFAMDVLKHRVPFGVPGLMSIVDVRDLAAVHAAVLQPGHGGRRYLAASGCMPVTEAMQVIAEAGGRRPPRGTMPASALLAIGRLADNLQRISPRRLPVHYEGPWSMVNMKPADTSATVRDLGIEFRPARETLVDAVRWVLNSTDYPPLSRIITSST